MDWTELIRADYWLSGAPGVVHVSAAVVALITGPLALLRRRKGDTTHRVLGLLFVAAMLFVNASAFSLYDISGSWTIFHYLAVANLISVIPGFWTARLFALTKDKNYLVAHATFMGWAITGVIGAGIAQLATRILPPLLGDTALFAFLAIYFAITGGLTAVLSHRFAQRTLRPGST